MSMETNPEAVVEATFVAVKAAIRVERARMGVEAAKDQIEVAKSAVEKARQALDESRSREAEEKRAMDEVLAGYEAQGINRKSLRQTAENSVASMMGTGLLTFAPLGTDEPEPPKAARPPKTARVAREKAPEAIPEPAPDAAPQADAHLEPTPDASAGPDAEAAEAAEPLTEAEAKPEAEHEAGPEHEAEPVLSEVVQEDVVHVRIAPPATVAEAVETVQSLPVQELPAAPQAVPEAPVARRSGPPPSFLGRMAPRPPVAPAA